MLYWKIEDGCLWTLILIVVLWTCPSQAGERLSVRPQDTGAALINPSMGWTMHFYSNIPKNYGSKLEPSDTLDDFPGLSTVYLRVPWAMFEPETARAIVRFVHGCLVRFAMFTSR